MYGYILFIIKTNGSGIKGGKEPGKLHNDGGINISFHTDVSY